MLGVIRSYLVISLTGHSSNHSTSPLPGWRLVAVVLTTAQDTCNWIMRVVVCLKWKGLKNISFPHYLGSKQTNRKQQKHIIINLFCCFLNCLLTMCEVASNKDSENNDKRMTVRKLQRVKRVVLFLICILLKIRSSERERKEKFFVSGLSRWRVKRVIVFLSCVVLKIGSSERERIFGVRTVFPSEINILVD